LVYRLQVPANNFQSTEVEGKNIQIIKYLNITMDKYVFYSNFKGIDMDDMDIVLGYP
jgi:hypothetical protein